MLTVMLTVYLSVGVGALLVVFSRNHNFIAKKLLEINENDRFTLGPGLMTEAEQDEALFQTARLVNGGWYVVHHGSFFL